MTYSKGQTINLDLGNGNHDYLVLKANGSIIELLCLYTVTEREFGNSQTYFGSIIDNWLENNFYKSLSLEAQSAIIFTPITQYSYAYNSSIFSPTTHVGGAVLKLAKKIATKNRHCYLLDVEDIEQYFNYTFSGNDLRKLFPDDSYTNGYPFYWLRSANSNYAYYVWRVGGSDGYVSDSKLWQRQRSSPSFYHWFIKNKKIRRAFAKDIAG